MPPQALELALAASIYPPAVVAVVALGKGPQLRTRVVAFVLAAVLVTYALGVLSLFILDEIGATGPGHWSPSAAFDLALGVVLLGVAFCLHKKPRPREPERPSKIERYLESRRLAFVLGITLYMLPSPIYVGAVKTVADAKLSTSDELLALVAIVVVMLWLIELPMLILLAVPGRAAGALERTNLWFTENGRMLGVIVAGGVGVYLATKGLVDLIG